MTVGQIVTAMAAYHERENQTLISRVSAVVRGLSTLGSRKGGRKADPFKGLLKRETKAQGGRPGQDMVSAFKGAAKQQAGKAKQGAVDQLRAARKTAKTLWFWEG